MTKEKSQAELEIEALADVFGIATTGFGEYYKSCKKKTKGDYSTAASSGSNSTAASSGSNSTAASSGDYSTAASSGSNSKAASSGDSSAATAVGYRAAVKGDKGNLLMVSEYIIKHGKQIPIGGKADIIDGKKLKADCWYIVEKGKWVEADFSDNIFSRVISTKGRVKKVKTDDGEILYVAHDENGNSAHGETIAKARKDLIYKSIARSDVKIPKEAKGKEWVGIYRAGNGACSVGVKMFVERTGKDIDANYTAKEISVLVKGQYGAEQFSASMDKNL